MNVPIKWLRDYVDINMEIKEFCDAMTMSGTKAEGYKLIGEGIENVVVGKIVDIKPHPDADKLIIVSVDAGKENLLQIVTGAKNVKENDLVPVALHGALLPDGTKIKKGKLRGEVSEGMLCSCQELDIEEKYVREDLRDGIFILDNNHTIGKDIREALMLNDAVVEFEITSNRPDCLSILGIAHEAAATFKLPLKMPENTYEEIDKPINFKVEVLEKNLCPRYIIKEITDVKIEESPYFIQRRLIESGIRPINNIVDITNYVMLEYGQPLHAFDKDKLSSQNKITLRRGMDGEKFTTLDEVERTVDSTMLLITDSDSPIAIAGVMGGLDSEVSLQTKNIIIESAIFDANNIRQTSKKLGLRTEASAKFEKGIDLSRAKEAVDRVCHLISYFGYGKVLKGDIDSLDTVISNKKISVNIDRINSLLGEELSPSEMVDILSRLKFKAQADKEKLNIEIPSFRLDIEMEADILEEIARLYGYNNIKSRNIVGELTSGIKSAEREFEDTLKDAMMANGLTEIMNYSFTSIKGLEKTRRSLENIVSLINPLGEETSIMRTSLIPGMIEVLSRNISKKVDFFGGFEIGNVFFQDENPVQNRAIIAGLYGKEEDFYSMKGRLEGVFEYIGLKNRDYIPSSEDPSFHPTRCAKIYSDDAFIGYIGEIHPFVLDAYNIKKRLYLFSLNFEVLMEKSEKNKLYSPVPKFPAIKRDIAIVIDEDIFVREIETIIKKNGNKLIEKIDLFDIYTGDQIESGKKSVAYSIIYRAKDRTLTDNEISEIQEKILNEIEEVLKGKLREL